MSDLAFMRVASAAAARRRKLTESVAGLGSTQAPHPAIWDSHVTQTSPPVRRHAAVRQLDDVGSVWRIGGAIPASDHISWIPAGSHGWVPLHAYVVIDAASVPRQVAVIDTSYPVIEAEILAGLDATVGRDAELTLVHTRPVEFESMGNTASILQARTVRTARTSVRLQDYAYFDPRWDPPARAERGPWWPHGDAIECRGLAAGDVVEIGSQRLDVLRAPLRLLATAWIYHRGSGTLFTSDSLAAGLLGDRDDCPVTDEPCWQTEELRAFLLAKFRWIERADITPLAAAFDEIVAGHDIRCLAPAHGRIVRGRAAARLLADYQTILHGYGSRGRP